MGVEKMRFALWFLGFLFLNGMFVFMARAEVHYYDFVLQEANLRLCSTKSMLTVNGSFPGPTITARRGDTIFVNVHNQGEYGVTIHWHGVKQPRNPWSDGPENITQCPIKPGTNFIYEVILSTEEGTLWWHAHSDWTRISVHGAIIILPPRGKIYPFPKPHEEQTIILGSWYKQDVVEMIDNATATGSVPDVSDAFTINGQPGDLYSCSNATTFRMSVESGKTYLLRIINAVMNEENFFGIARHKLTVIGQDAAYIKPITTDYIMIAPGQTMDVLVTANRIPSHYYMAASPFVDGDVVFDNTTTTAIVQYKGKYSVPSSPFFPNLPSYNDSDAAESFTNRIKGLPTMDHPINVPKNITTRIYIAVSVNLLLCPNHTCSGPGGDRQAASLNNVSFNTPKIDILQAYYRNLSNVFDRDFPSKPPTLYNFTGDTSNVSLYTAQGTKAFMINYGEEVEVVFQASNIQVGESHPMHLHGFSFYKVATGPGNYYEIRDPSRYYNLVDPPEVNTVNLPKGGWTAIRFVDDNPGVWFMHCHFERHASWGMDTVFIVRNGPTNETSIRPPPANLPSCS